MPDPKTEPMPVFEEKFFQRRLMLIGAILVGIIVLASQIRIVWIDRQNAHNAFLIKADQLADHFVTELMLVEQQLDAIAGFIATGNSFTAETFAQFNRVIDARAGLQSLVWLVKQPDDTFRTRVRYAPGKQTNPIDIDPGTQIPRQSLRQAMESARFTLIRRIEENSSSPFFLVKGVYSARPDAIDQNAHSEFQGFAVAILDLTWILDVTTDHGGTKKIALRMRKYGEAEARGSLIRFQVPLDRKPDFSYPLGKHGVDPDIVLELWDLAGVGASGIESPNFVLEKIVLLLLMLALAWQLRQVFQIWKQHDQHVRDSYSKLRRSEDRLQQAQAIGRMGSWYYELESDVQEWSNFALQILGVDPHQKVSPTIFKSHVHPNDRELWESNWKSATQGSPYRAEYRVIVNGNTYWVEDRAEPLFDENGAVYAFVGTVLDITERKRIEKNHKRLLAIIDATPDFIAIMTPSGRVEFLNAGARNLLGIGLQEDVSTLTVPDLHPEWSSKLILEQWFPNAIRAGHWRGETIFLRRDGSEIPVSQLLIAHKEPDGNVEYFSKIARDVSAMRDLDEQKRLTRELERQGAEISAILSNLVDAVITANQSGVFLTANPAIERVFGYLPEEIIGEPLSLLLPELRWAELVSPNIPGARGERTPAANPGFEISGRNKSGRRIPIRMTFSQYWVGENSYYAASLTDLSEYKRLISEMEAARDRAEIASTAKSDFLAAMSHEIRTPMNGVIAMVELLGQSSLDSDQGEMVELISESAHALLNIIEDILDFSKIEANKLSIVNEPFSVAITADKVCMLLYRIAAKKNVEVSLFVDPKMPRIMEGDGSRLRQILINLINNAIKFSGGGEQRGQVAVRVDISRAEDHRLWVDFSVQDNGIGMEESTIARLFKPFEQAEASISRRFGGTGLGLVIARKLAIRMGGDIRVSSTPGIGSTFCVSLPFVVTTQPLVPASALCGTSCLLIGVDTDLAGDIACYLQHSGISVQCVSDLNQARTVPADLRDAHWVLILDKDRCPIPIDQLHRSFEGDAFGDRRFVLIGNGMRLHPQWIDENLVQIDRNFRLFRNLLATMEFGLGSTVRANDDNLNDPGNSAQRLGLDQARQYGIPILVVEDNETNQKIIKRQLALLGLTAEIANDGCEAIEFWKKGIYRAVLTDIRMPNMDGFELVAAIRSAENMAESERTPVIALTANAVGDEAERCLAAGMDEYLTKPVSLQDLKTTLEKALAVDISVASEMHSRSFKTLPVNTEVLQELVGDDPATILEFLEDFRKRATQITSDLDSAYESEDMEKIRALSHKLKSSARSVGALKLGDLLEAMEHSVARDDRRSLDDQYKRFQAEIRAVGIYLKNRIESPDPMDSDFDSAEVK